MSTTQDPFDTAPPAAGGPSGPRAGFRQRLAASLVDGLILVVPVANRPV